MPGATTNMVTLSNLGASDRTNYFVVISNSANVLTSSVANLTVRSRYHPAASLRDKSRGLQRLPIRRRNWHPPPLTYQWRRGRFHSHNADRGSDHQRL